MGVKSLKIYTGKFSPYDHFPKEPICTKTCMPILRQGNFLRKNFSFFFLNLKPPSPTSPSPENKQTDKKILQEKARSLNICQFTYCNSLSSI